MTHTGLPFKSAKNTLSGPGYGPGSGGPGVYIPPVPQAATAAFLSIFGGGPGSGCHGDNCGPKGGKQAVGAPTWRLGKSLSHPHLKQEPLHSTWVQHPNWKNQAYGGILVNKQGQFLLREPTHHFDGYSWTFAKGKMDSPAEHPVDVALREVAQETGHSGKIFDELPGTYGSPSGSYSSYYLMQSGGHDPSQMDKETKNTRWASYEEAKQLISQSKNSGGRKRDLMILDIANHHLNKFYDPKKIVASTEEVEITAGGPGSGCHGDNCGRPAGPGGAPTGKTNSHSWLTHHGWNFVQKTGDKLPNGKLWNTKTTYSHPKLGTIVIDHSGPAYTHTNKEGVTVGFGKTGKFSNDLGSYLKKVSDAAPKSASVTPPEPKPVSTPVAHKAEEPSQPKEPSGRPPAGLAKSYSHEEGGVVKNTYTWDPVQNKYAAATGKLTLSPTDAKVCHEAGWIKPITPSEAPAHTKSWEQEAKDKAAQSKPEYTIPESKAVLKEQQQKAAPPTSQYVPVLTKAGKFNGLPQTVYSVTTGKTYEYKPAGAKYYGSKAGFYDKASGTAYSFKNQAGAAKGLQTNLAKGQLVKGSNPNPGVATHEWQNGTLVPKGSTPGTSTASPTQTASPTATSPASKPDQPQFSYVGPGKSLGGAHDKYLFKDAQGSQWLFKPATALSGAPSPVIAHADEAAAKIQSLIRPNVGVEAKATTLSIPGKGDQFGSIQKMVPDVASSKVSSADFQKPEVVKALQQEHVVDWLISNHDSHGGQFLQTKDGNVVGIDKSQAFKYFPNDKLSTDYHPNAQYGENPPIYNNLFTAAKQGSVKFDPQDAWSAIKKAQSIPDDQYKKILEPYADAKVKAFGGDKEEFLKAAVDRKNSLQSDFEKFYSGVTGKDFKFDTTAGYSPMHTDAVKSGKITQETHQALEDAGYKYSKLGAASGKPLYKDSEGKAVYIDNNKWEYYPMGTSGSNKEYGKSLGEGLEGLKKVLVDPFEKPSFTAPAKTSTSTYESPKNQSITQFNLPSVPWDAADHLHKVDTGEKTGGQPEDHTNSIDKSAYPMAEKGAVTEYKGMASTAINQAAKTMEKKMTESEWHNMVKQMDSAVMRTSTKDDVVVWRGLHGKYVTDLITKYLVHKDLTDHAPATFQETSTSQSMSHNSFAYGDYGGLMLRMHVPKGTPVIPTTTITSSHQGEKGLIFSREITWQFNHAYESGGKIYFDVTLKHPGVTAMVSKDMTSKEHSEYMHAAAKLGFKMEDFEAAMAALANPGFGSDQTRAMALQLQLAVEKKKF